MPAAFIYLLKFSVSLGIVFLFYQLVLRKLTFYNWNRWYLLGYSLLSFVIPFIDISAAFHQNQLTGSNMVQWIPLLYYKEAANTPLTVWNILSLLIIIGMVVMFSRLIIQLFSFRKMMKKAQLISRADVSIYQVNETIIPFSFGNAVFINRHLHTEKELEEIIRHEFVHVKQRHSIDIILGEILCLLNWYNPFAWMLRSAIRQNLEFVADNKVLENGISKKQYQYLLLKVIGNNQFSIAQKFNFSSLKKRIAMMNKNKSAKLHLLRFLFLLPVLAFMLVSFRKEIGNTLTGKEKPLQSLLAAAIDTVPEVFTPNSKGYIINVKDQEGKCLLVIKDQTGKVVKRVLLTEWNANLEKFEANYGEIPPPPPTPLPEFVKRTDNNVDWIEVWFKNGEKEKEIYNFKIPAQKAAFEKKYGNGNFIIPPPPPPAPSVPLDVVIVREAPLPPTPPQSVDMLTILQEVPPPPAPIKLPANVQKLSISTNIATVTLKNGQKENYDFNNAEQKAKFESKYGEFVSPPPPPPLPAKDKNAPSVDIQFNGKVENADASLLGRGNPNSIGGSIVKAVPDDVLYILDGVEIKRSDLDKLDPDKIESINILKGNSAVTIHGDKGSNGVIIIKTKNSEKVKPIT